jgi:3-oxoacyl-[acyl-carrier protein] reductase
MKHGIGSTIGAQIVRPPPEEHNNQAAKPHFCCAPGVLLDYLLSEVKLDTGTLRKPKGATYFRNEEAAERLCVRI